MATKMVCDVQGTLNLAEWVCDKCGFGWVAAEVLECKVCTLEADLELARKERREDLKTIISKSNEITKLQFAEAEAMALCVNHEGRISKLYAQMEGLKLELQIAENRYNRLMEAAKEVVRISDRDHEAWKKLKALFVQNIPSDLENELRISREIQAAEKQILINEIEINLKLRNENEILKQFRSGTIHNAWFTAPRDLLIEALQFQGALTKEYSEKYDRICKTLETLIEEKQDAIHT